MQQFNYFPNTNEEVKENLKNHQWLITSDDIRKAYHNTITDTNIDEEYLDLIYLAFDCICLELIGLFLLKYKDREKQIEIYDEFKKNLFHDNELLLHDIIQKFFFSYQAVVHCIFKNRKNPEDELIIGENICYSISLLRNNELIATSSRYNDTDVVDVHKIENDELLFHFWMDFGRLIHTHDSNYEFGVDKIPNRVKFTSDKRIEECKKKFLIYENSNSIT